MPTLTSQLPMPVQPFKPNPELGSKLFAITRSAARVTCEEGLLLPHRKAYYQLVFVKQHRGRHWVDTVPYENQDNTCYFTDLAQVQVKEVQAPFWGTMLQFTPEFLALQQNAGLRELPLIQNPYQGHELRLTAADGEVVEDLLLKIEAEYQRPGEWQHRMLSAYLTVLLTYLSRLYTEQYSADESVSDQRLLKAFQAKIEEGYRELHEVSAYAAMLHISAGHLSEVVKAQSGKSAIKHVHNRLVLEARRLLFYTSQSLKEIAFDLGFSDASYFNRFFKRETGATPAEYRASIREMYQ